MNSPMKLSQYINEFPIFETMAAFPDYPFPVDDAGDWDILLSIEHGQKAMFENLLKLQADTVATVVFKKFIGRWNALLEREALLDNVNNRVERTEIINKTEDTSSESSGVSKVSAYDSDVMVDNEGSSNDSSNSMTGESVKTIVDEKIDVKNSFKMLNVDVRDTIMSSVVSDVASFLTLSIY